MTEIPIQIKKGQAAVNKAASDIRVDLKNGLPKKKTSRFWRVVLVFLLLANLGVFSY